MTARALLTISGLLFALMVTSACRSSGKPEAAPGEPAKKEQAEKRDEGVVKLSEEEIKSSGIATTEAVEGQVSDTVLIQGRVIPRSGKQATVIPPFPGRLLAGADFPRLGNVV